MNTQIFGEHKSNWGRVICEMRVRLNDNDQILDDASVLSYTLDNRIAWGSLTINSRSVNHIMIDRYKKSVSILGNLGVMHHICFSKLLLCHHLY